jgi:hypothetical protein
MVRDVAAAIAVSGVGTARPQRDRRRVLLLLSEALPLVEACLLSLSKVPCVSQRGFFMVRQLVMFTILPMVDFFVVVLNMFDDLVIGQVMRWM